MTAVVMKSSEEQQINVLTDEILAKISELKSYIPAEEREFFIKEKKLTSLCTAEIIASMKIDDLDTSWKWLSLVALPPHALRSLKKIFGSQFIRDKKLITLRADELYGSNWLDR